jgi:hypothetical protein
MRWLDNRASQNVEIRGWTAAVGYDVVGMTDANNAINTIPYEEGDSCDIPGLEFLTCLKVDCVEYKFTLARCVAYFGVTYLVGGASTPLTYPGRILWKRGKNSKAVNSDIYGDAITDAAGTPVRGNPPRNYSVRYLTLKYYVPYYDQAQADMYMDTTNSDSVTFEGITYAPGQMYCLNIAPTSEYQDGCNFIEVQYDFEIRSTVFPGSTIGQQRFPFQYRFVNEGLVGWWNDTSGGGAGVKRPGNFYFHDGNQMNIPCLLNWDGTPLDSTITVSSSLQTPAANPNPIVSHTTSKITSLTQSFTGTSVLWEQGSEMYTAPLSGPPVYLIYMLYPELPFNDIVPD